MRPRETPNLAWWREASKAAVRASLESADLFTEFLVAGGPDAIKSLNQTIRKLQSQLKEHEADKRLERYRKLQKDLEECHKVRDGLRDALRSANWTDDEIDAHLNKGLFKANTLYGASRELLLQENRILRAQLEEHLVTSRTSRAAGPPAPNRATVPGSKLKQARMMQGPHMENVARLIEAAETLDKAERGYKLPSVAHAEVQADDGSRRHIQTLEQQLATLAGQKLQLLQQVAALTEQNRVLDMKLEGALDQVSDLRRQKTEMLAHQENLSADLREHLLSEAKRADTAEASLAEAKLVAAESRKAEEAARAQMERAMAEAQAMRAALQEKAEQVDTLRGLYMELREALEKLAGDVTAGQQEAARRLLDATTAQLQDHGALLGDVKAAVDDTYRATQHHTDTVVELTSQQRALTAEVAKASETTAVTLGAYERQLGVTQHLLMQSEAERARLVRQALAASALARMEDKRHEKAVKRLLTEVPKTVAELLVPKLEAVEEGTLMVAEEVAKTKDTLADAGVGAGGPGTRGGMLHAPLVPDEVDDATTRLLGDSKLLRAQLLGLAGGQHALAGGGPGPRPDVVLAEDERRPFVPVPGPSGDVARLPISTGLLPPLVFTNDPASSASPPLPAPGLLLLEPVPQSLTLLEPMPPGFVPPPDQLVPGPLPPGIMLAPPAVQPPGAIPAGPASSESPPPPPPELLLLEPVPQSLTLLEPMPPGLVPPPDHLAPGPLPPGAVPAPPAFMPPGAVLTGTGPPTGLVLEPIWPHPVAPVFAANRPSFAGPYVVPEPLASARPPRPAVPPSRPPGRMDLVLHLKPKGTASHPNDAGSDQKMQELQQHLHQQDREIQEMKELMLKLVEAPAPAPPAPPPQPSAPMQFEVLMYPEPSVRPGVQGPEGPTRDAPAADLSRQQPVTPSPQQQQPQAAGQVAVGQDDSRRQPEEPRPAAASGGGVEASRPSAVPAGAAAAAAVGAVVMSLGGLPPGRDVPQDDGGLPQGVSVTKWAPSRALLEAFREKVDEGGAA